MIIHEKFLFSLANAFVHYTDLLAFDFANFVILNVLAN